MSIGLEFRPNRLYYGDCLDVLREWPAQCVDLIYLDPPFNSKANYNVLYGSKNGASAEVRAFSDTWYWDEAAALRMETLERAPARRSHAALTGLRTILGDTGMLAYLSYMAERLEKCRRVLRDHGSLWLHCDPTASHYLKVLLDAIFGPNHFRNEIIWCYTGPGSPKMRQFNRKHDTIFWYAKGNSWTFNTDAARVPHAGGAPHSGGFKTDNRKLNTEEAKRYGEKGKILESWWCQARGNGLAIAARQPSQYLGYPTQKPIALLQRIVEASSNPGDVVLDPFCGCGTTIAAADRTKRQWVGIDVSPFAVKLVRDRRLRPAGRDAEIAGIPTDMEGARMMLERNAFDFEAWAVTSVPGLAPNERQVGDRGIDGRGAMMHPPDGTESRLVVAQVKGGGYTASSMRDFQRVIERENAAAGIYITLQRADTRNARQAAAELRTFTMGAQRYPRLQLWSIEELLDGRMPQLPDMADPYTGQRIRQAELFG